MEAARIDRIAAALVDDGGDAGFDPSDHVRAGQVLRDEAIGHEDQRGRHEDPDEQVPVQRFFHMPSSRQKR